MKRRNYTVQLLANGQWHDERSFADLIDATEFAYFLGADRARVVEAAPTAGRRPGRSLGARQGSAAVERCGCVVARQDPRSTPTGRSDCAAASMVEG